MVWSHCLTPRLRYRDRYKMGFIELCAAVHTAQTPTQTRITIEPIVVCIGVGVGQCERTIRAEHH